MLAVAPHEQSPQPPPIDRGIDWVYIAPPKLPPKPDLIMEEFHKVRRLPPYVFEQVNRLKASARSRGADIIDLGMGNPDLPTPTAIVDKLCEVVRDPRTHRYSSSRGIPGLRRAQAGYYAAPLRREARSRDAGRRDARLQGRLRQHGAGDHRAWRRDPVPQPDLSDPRLRLHHVGRRHPLAAGRARCRLHPGAGARHPAFDPEAAGADPQLPVEPDGAGRHARLLQGRGRLRPQARHHHPVRSRLFRDLFR